MPGTGELAVILGAVIGAGLGFLWFNAPPAAIFMGDTGSLALGGLIGTIAVATKHEIVLAIIGGLFVMEALSVIIQVGFFKMTGKRVFLMAPIHHHFEKLGWTESQVVIRFWIIAVILALVGLSTPEAAVGRDDPGHLLRGQAGRALRPRRLGDRDGARAGRGRRRRAGLGRQSRQRREGRGRGHRDRRSARRPTGRASPPSCCRPACR